MRCDATVKKRVFSIRDITEEEGLILRTLLNLNEEGVRNKLNRDDLYWNDDIEEEEAVAIGHKLCEEIMEMVDNI